MGFLIGIAVFALLCSVWNITAMNKELSLSTEEFCDGITSQIAKEIRDGVSFKMIELVNVADSVSDVYETGNEGRLNEFFKRKADILEFDAMILINARGKGIAGTLKNGMVLNAQKLIALPDVQESFQGGVNMGFFDRQTLFYSAPVTAEGKERLVLVGIRGKENMQSMIDSKAFHGKTLSCIVNSEGDVVLSPTDLSAFLYLDDILQEQSQKQTIADIHQMEEDIRAGTDGMIRFLDENKNQNMLAYNKLGINDWTLLTIVPENLFADSLSRYSVRSMLIMGGIFLAFFAYLLIIYRIFMDNRKRLTQIAFTDPITGGMNNAAFRMQYEKYAAEGELFPYAVVLLNVENFKRINEKFGFAAGNRTLSYIYQRITAQIDAEKKEFAARSETDHFFLCIQESDQAAVQNRIERLVWDINAFHDADCPRYPMSFTAACCLTNSFDLEINAAQDRARIAMQSRDKGDGKKYVFYNDAIAKRIKREQEIEELFEESLARGDFVVYLQPKMNLVSGKPEGAEALIRWKHPQQGMISPAEFVPLFERTGKICLLDYYVFREVCRFYQRRRQEGKPWYPVSINLSRYHFYEEAPLNHFYQVYKMYNMPEHSIEFELTESMFFGGQHVLRLREEIRNMHERGILCSMDDFGSGYSSLGFLREFDVDILKLDRSFFLDMSNRKAKKIIQSIVELAVKLNIKTVAEGIEQPDQMDFLRSIHCDMIQGYYFSKPLPFDEFETWVGQFETMEI